MKFCLIFVIFTQPVLARSTLHASSQPASPNKRIYKAHENLRDMSLALGRDDCSPHCFKKAKAAVETLEKYKVINSEEAQEHRKLILKQEKDYHGRKGIQVAELKKIEAVKESRHLETEHAGHLAGDTEMLDRSIKFMLLDGNKAKQLSDSVLEKLIHDTDLPSQFVKQSLEKLEKIPFLKIDKDAEAKLQILAIQVSVQPKHEAQLRAAQKKLERLKAHACEKLAYSTCRIAEESEARIQAHIQKHTDEQLLQWLHPGAQTLFSQTGSHILLPHLFGGNPSLGFNLGPQPLWNPYSTLSPYWASPWGF